MSLESELWWSGGWHEAATGHKDEWLRYHYLAATPLVITVGAMKASTISVDDLIASYSSRVNTARPHR
jgi:hypothetical protein